MHNHFAATGHNNYHVENMTNFGHVECVDEAIIMDIDNLSTSQPCTCFDPALDPKSDLHIPRLRSLCSLSEAQLPCASENFLCKLARRSLSRWPLSPFLNLHTLVNNTVAMDIFRLESDYHNSTFSKGHEHLSGHNRTLEA
jgi:hypothetical protein